MNDWLAARPLLRFLLAVVALMPATFLAWYFLGYAVTAPVVLIVEPLLLHWLPDAVTFVSLQGTDLLVLTPFGEDAGRLIAASEARNQIGYPVDTRTLSFSLPFFAALYFATPNRGGLERFSWSVVALWLLLAAGLVSVTLKNLMLGLGSTFLQMPLVPNPEVIALLFQFSTLMVPPLAPVILWAYTARDSEAFAALLPPSLRPAQRSD